MFSAALLLLSCNDGFLDKTPLDKLSEDAVFNSGSLSEYYVNALYTVLPDPFQEGNTGCISDEGYFRFGGTSTRYVASGNMTPDNVMYMYEGGAAHDSRTTVLNIWNRAYERIYRMNYFLAYVEQNQPEMSESDLNRLKGEVYFLRAWAYTNLIERYAGVPIIDKPFKLGDDYTATRDNFDDCVDFILSDLEKAESMVPDKTSSVLGRVNKDVVLALRSRLTLIAASPLFNDPDRPEGGIFRGTYSKDKWTRALNASKAIVDRADVDGAYSLDDTYDGYWKDVNSPEVIWAKYFVNKNGNKAQLYYSVVYFNGWTAFNPTQAMSIDYEMTNGKKIFEEGSGFDTEHPYKNRDPRFYKSVAAPFSTYTTTSEGKTTDYVLDLALYFKERTRADFAVGKTEPVYDSKSKYLWDATNTMGLELNKWYIPTLPITEEETGTLMFPWFRLAEMYLNYAECAYMVGDEGTCRQYINKIRHRADVNMPEVTEAGEPLWDRLVNERRIELAFESFRYFDVRRWKTAPFYENIPFAGMKTMILTTGTKQDTVYRVARPYDATKNDRCYYWPNSDARTAYVAANGTDIQYIVTYSWLGKEYQVDYGDCCLNVSPTQKRFPKVGDEYPNYLMPIPSNEMIKSEGKLVQNPGY